MKSRNEQFLEVAKAISENPDLRDSLWLVFNNVPFNVAFSLKAEERLAWGVVLAGFRGMKFDWKHGRYEEPGA